MKEFFLMGGYAFFVWTSYGIVAAVLIGNVIAAKSHRRRVIEQIQQLKEEE